MRLLVALTVFCAWAAAQSGIPAALELKGLRASETTFKGRAATRIDATTSIEPANEVAILKEVAFKDGTIEVWVSGEPGPVAAADARGFVGIAFHVRPGGTAYECFYLRPTNGRATDQVRRNHSAQYTSRPEYDWQRLRKESPEKYESYVDLEPGVWTRMKIVVAGRQARLYVHGAEQPTLVVNDLLLGDAGGGIALWAGPGTTAHFADLRITP